MTTAFNAEIAENAENGGYGVTATGPFQAATARKRNAENGLNPGNSRRQRPTALLAATARERVLAGPMPNAKGRMPNARLRRGTGAKAKKDAASEEAAVPANPLTPKREGLGVKRPRTRVGYTKLIMDARQASSHNKVPDILAGEKKCRWSKPKKTAGRFCELRSVSPEGGCLQIFHLVVKKSRPGLVTLE